MPAKKEKTAEEILTGPCTGIFRERWGPEVYADRVDDMWKDENPMLKKASVDHVSKACGYEAARQIQAEHKHSGTILHDIDEKLEKAIKASTDAIRAARNKSKQ